MKEPLRPDQGFSLVEVLVSIAVLSLIAAYSLSALRYVQEAKQFTDRVEMQSEVDAVARHFRLAIAGLRPVLVDTDSGTSRLVFQGSPDSLAFVAASDGNQEIGGLLEVRYFLDSGGVLQVERQVLRHGRPTQADTVALLRDVKQIVFRYWPAATTGADDRALASWDDERHLPSAIAVEVSFPASDGRVWPPTLISVRTAR